MSSKSLKKIVFVLMVPILLSVLTLPVSGAQEEGEDVVIVTRQPKGAFSAVVEDGKTALKNWEVHFYHKNEDENHVYKIVVDGRTVEQGEFEGFHHVVKESFAQGHFSKVKVYLDGNVHLWEDIDVMKKAPTREELREATGPESIAMSVKEWIMQQLGLIVLGCVLGLAAIVTQRWFVKKRKNAEVLEGF